jgi:hypothetical protein
VIRQTTYLIAGALCAGVALMVTTETPRAFGGTFCSVFNHYPCAPTACSVFRHHPCRPFYGFPLGENLQLTIESKGESDKAKGESDKAGTDGSPKTDATTDHDVADHDVNTIREMFAALRTCWQPPPMDSAHEGMQMSVRFSFTQAGKLKGEPRITYFTPGTSDDIKQLYRHAIAAALDRCTPMAFTPGMAGAIAGRPIAVRFIDNRKPAEDQP